MTPGSGFKLHSLGAMSYKGRKMRTRRLWRRRPPVGVVRPIPHWARLRDGRSEFEPSDWALSVKSLPLPLGGPAIQPSPRRSNAAALDRQHGIRLSCVRRAALLANAALHWWPNVRIAQSGLAGRLGSCLSEAVSMSQSQPRPSGAGMSIPLIENNK
jgi:hypothetical protein